MCQGTCQPHNELSAVGQLIASVGPTQHETLLVECDRPPNYHFCLSFSLRVSKHRAKSRTQHSNRRMERLVVPCFQNVVGQGAKHVPGAAQETAVLLQFVFPP